MGNMPNRWVGRGAALVAAAVLGIFGFLGGRFVGERLAGGFRFDWYVRDGARAFAANDALLAMSLVAALAALLALVATLIPTALLTRFWSARVRYTPPRFSEPVSLDVLAGRLLFALPFAAAALAALLAYAVLASPMLPPQLGGSSGAPISRVSDSGYVLLVAAGGAFGAAFGALVGTLMAFTGVVSGKVVRESKKNLIARISLFGMRNAKTTVALILAVTLVAGYYATSVNTNVDVADVLPRGDPNTAAAHNLTEKFKSSFTQQVTFQFRILNQSNATQREVYEKDNDKRLGLRTTEANPSNITDELYIRAMSEVIDYVLTQPPFTGTVGAPEFYKLINWTIAGGQTDLNRAGNASYALPTSETQEGEIAYRTVHEGVVGVGAVFEAVDAVTSPSWTQTATLVLVDPKSSASTKEIGEAALRVRDSWVQRVENGETEYKVFGPDNPPQFSVDLPIANAHASALTKHDFTLLLPIIAVFIAVTLFIAFRSVVAVVITFSMLAIAVVWTFGVMGAMRIPLNTLNLATVPLIMGVGIDYGIHMMNEYDELRHAGKSAEEAWTEAGGGSALALFVATLTTISGLLVMVLSPSLLVSQLGLLSAIAIASCLTLAILFIPAFTTIVTSIRGPTARTRKEYRPSRIMPALATGVSRARWFVLVALVLLAGASIAAAANIRREAFGDPPRNWLETDPLRQEHERSIQGFYERTDDAVKANVLIFEGDITDPAVHRYISAITETLRSNGNNESWTDPATGEKHTGSRIITDTLKDLPFLANTYLTVRNGAPGAAQYLGNDALAAALGQLGQPRPEQAQNYPQTREGIKAMLDETHDSPLYQFQNLFIDHPTYGMTVTIFSVDAATYNDAEEVWNEVMAAVATNEPLRPEGMHVSFFGNTAINYLFVAKQVPWLGYMSIATNILVVIIVFAFTRSVRATLVVGACNFLSSTLWLGALTLPFIDIGLAITLTLPLVFIFCMGSDYGLHLALRCKKVGDTYLTFESVGKGVLYSFITTFGAFLVFTQISDLAGRRSMIATAIAIGVVFVMTLALVPIFYPVKKHQRKGASDRNVPLVDKRSSSVTAPGKPTTPPAHRD